MIFEKLKSQLKFTHTERSIADFLLANSSQIETMTASDLGQQTFTSKASVLRFCQKLGLSGFKEFKTKFMLEQSQRTDLYKFMAKNAINERTDARDLLTIVPGLYNQTLDAVGLNLNRDYFQRLVNRLKPAQVIDFYGSGITESCATAAAFKFQTLGLSSHAHTTVNQHYIVSTQNVAHRVAFIISFTGSNPTMVASAEYLRQHDVYTIGIGSAEKDNLKQACDDYLEIPAQQTIMSLEFLPSYLAVNYMLDLLFCALLVNHFDDRVDDAVTVKTENDQRG